MNAPQSHFHHLYLSVCCSVALNNKFQQVMVLSICSMLFLLAQFHQTVEATAKSEKGDIFKTILKYRWKFN